MYSSKIQFLSLLLTLVVLLTCLGPQVPVWAAKDPQSALHYVDDKAPERNFDWDFLEEHRDELEMIQDNLEIFSQAIPEIIEDSSLVYSPLSLYLALVALRPGLTGESRDALDAVLNPTAIPDADFEATMRLIYGLGLGDPPVEDEDSFHPWLSQTLAIGAENLDLQFAPEYTAALRRMGMRAAHADLSQKSTFQAINDLVADVTQGLIDPFYSDQQIEEKTQQPLMLMLINMLYFKGQWANQFDHHNTEEQTFYGQEAAVETPMMRQTLRVPYLETEDYQAVQLPYETGGQFVLVMPKKSVDRDAAFQYLTAANQSQDWQTYDVVLTLPRWEQEANLDLLAVLEKLDLDYLKAVPQKDVIAFDRGRDMKISDISQKVVLKVDEEGTEAAAVTAVEMEMLTALPEPFPLVEMSVDHPFVYQLEDYGLPLIVGSLFDLPE